MIDMMQFDEPEEPIVKEGYSLHCADTLEFLATLPNKCFDITVTSPPYNQLDQCEQYGTGKMAGDGWLQSINQDGYSDNRTEEEYQKWLHDVILECFRVTKGLVWVNHKVRYRDGKGIHPLHFLNFPFYSEVIWDHRSGVALNAKKFCPSHEVIYGFGKPHWWDDASNTRMTCWQIPHNREPDAKGHPCPFPTEIPKRLILASCPPEGTVFDPFMGLATTGKAAIMNGRKFVGCDRVAKYVNLAGIRLENL